MTDQVIQRQNASSLRRLSQTSGANHLFKPSASQLEVIGVTSYLCARDKFWRRAPTAFTKYWFHLPILLSQCRIFSINSTPIGMVTWSWFSDEAASRFSTFLGEGSPKLPPETDHLSGEHLWITGWLSPFGLRGDRVMYQWLRSAMREPQVSLWRTSQDNQFSIQKYKVDGDRWHKSYVKKAQPLIMQVL
ncbi:MAG: hypothetical protein COA47_06100 [Robiginitomaculum sp.]|nr:MAG: hypothetical protein COA47_06100 [Robiginitomaculum sp.]